MTAMIAYITAGSQEEARRVADALIGDRLAACVNIYPSITSVFEWEGEVNHDEEVVLIAKTTEAGFDRLKEKVCEVHSYDCPCVVGIKVEKGHQPFLDWIGEQVQ